jgi:hypothetical protein
MTARKRASAGSSGLGSTRSERRADVERAIGLARESRRKSWEALFPWVSSSSESGSLPTEERKRQPGS